jgi:hypothetical protein
MTKISQQILELAMQMNKDQRLQLLETARDIVDNDDDEEDYENGGREQKAREVRAKRVTAKDVAEKPARKMRTPAFDDMKKSELAEHVRDLGVRPKDVSEDLAHFLKRTYKLASEMTTPQLKQKAEKKNLEIDLGEGHLTPKERRLTLAAQILVN